jgi:amino acid permease
MTLCYGCCVFNAAIVGNIAADCAQTMGLNNIPRGRAISLPLFMLLPICLQDDLSGLQVSSAMGTVGIAYTVLFLVKRWLDQTYAPGSYFLKYVDPELRPHFTSSSSSGLSWLRINSGTLVLANLLCVAFLAQHNSITYFRELNSTLEQYQKGITYGFGITAAVFLMMMFVGYQMFGNAAQPLMLNNFPDKDRLANMARLCVGAAMAFAFPVMFIALKSAMSALIDTATVPRNRLSGDIKSVSRADDGDSFRANKWKTIATVVTLVSITKIAEQCNRNEVSSVLGIIVSVFGCLVAYILPNYLNILHNHQRHKAGLTTNRREVAMNYFMAILGALFGVLGVWMAVTNTAAHH